MNRSSFQDIVPADTDKRTIRNIPLNRPPTNLRPETVPPPPRPTIKRYQDESRPRKKSGWLKFGIGLVVILALVYFGFSFFDGATLKVTPKEVSQNISLTVSASKDTSLPLRFNLISVSNEMSKTVVASSSAKVTQKAQGGIVIYNNYSTAPQTLVANTRFQTSSGLIYRILGTVIVPGQATQNGKTVPGSITANVVADQPGDSYNIPASDFTIPGFKSDAARYSGFYARSKTAMSGGFVGIAPQLSSADRVTAKTVLDAELKTTLVAQANSQIPGDFIMYPDGVSVSYSSLPDQNATSSDTAGGQSLLITEKGTLYGIIFSKNDLSEYIAAKSVNGFDPNTSKISIPNLQNLTLSLQDKNNWSATTTNVINFNLTGSSTIIWQFDQNALKQDLIGKNKNDIQPILGSKYPAIERIQVLIRPFWQSTLPKNPSKILVDITQN